MRKKKNLGQRMEAVKALAIENPEAYPGRWREMQSPEALLFVELGCGKGQFARALAAQNPGELIIAVEKLPDVLVMAMEAALQEDVQNLRFVSRDAGDLPQMFIPGEIDRLFINFCDPWPHWKQANRRLLHRGFLDKYRPLLASGGTLRFKTDNAPLFAFAQKELAAAGWHITSVDPDLPRSPGNIETEYEARFRDVGTPIGFLEASPSVDTP